MNRLMAARRPTGALLNAQSMIGSADEQASGIDLLEMAFQTKICIAHRQEFCIHRAVRRVTNRAALARGFVFKNIRTALGLVTTETALILREQRGPAPDIS